MSDANLIALAEEMAKVADVRRDQASNAKGTSEYVPFRTAALVLDSISAALGVVAKDRVEGWP